MRLPEAAGADLVPVALLLHDLPRPAPARSPPAVASSSQTRGSVGPARAGRGGARRGEAGCCLGGARLEDLDEVALVLLEPLQSERTVNECRRGKQCDADKSMQGLHG